MPTRLALMRDQVRYHSLASLHSASATARGRGETRDDAPG